MRLDSILKFAKKRAKNKRKDDHKPLPYGWVGAGFYHYHEQDDDNENNSNDSGGDGGAES